MWLRSGCALPCWRCALTAQLTAARQGHDGIVALLLQHGWSVDARDEHGLTPLHYAALGRHSATFAALQQALLRVPPAHEGQHSDDSAKPHEIRGAALPFQWCALPPALRWPLPLSLALPVSAPPAPP